MTAPIDSRDASLPAGEQEAAGEGASGQGELEGRWGAVFLTTATTVFLAELGDKTQLAALLLSAQSGRPAVVFLGASLALVSSSLVGVLLGRWLSRLMPPHQLERSAGVVMLALGLWLGRQTVLQVGLPSLPLG
jgi:putative Ca2+/H+ antiporter (TMEM165/GDT1 family)